MVELEGLLIVIWMGAIVAIGFSGVPGGWGIMAKEGQRGRHVRGGIGESACSSMDATEIQGTRECCEHARMEGGCCGDQE